MTESIEWIAVDWGTSNLRAWGMGADGTALVPASSDQGMGKLKPEQFPAALQAVVAQITPSSDAIDVVICGMAGARQGWMEAPYLDAPTDLSRLGQGAVHPEVLNTSLRVSILPGVCQRQGGENVMRGEETQLLGLASLFPGYSGLVCMPGTHSKWVRVRGGSVERFSTFMTGELFSAVSRETILSLAVAGAGEAEDVASFKAAVKAAYAAPAFAANLLFTARSRQLLFGGTPNAARETLSGTLIGAELAAGLSSAVPRAGVTLIASGRLAALYRHAFDALSVMVQPLDADEAVRRGLSMAAAAIWAKKDP